MKALLLSQYNHLEIAEFPVPKPGSHEVLIRVAACGICGSDVHGYDGTSGRRIPPIVMGHEAAGSIAALGAGVTNLAENDRVTFDSTISCGACAFCLRGEVNLCNRREVLGVSCGDYSRAGAFAEYVLVPSRIVYRLPASISFPEAALLEAVAVAAHAVSLAGNVTDHNVTDRNVTVRTETDRRVTDRNVTGRSALVIGAGTIGLLCLQVLRAAGCSHVIITDVDATRLALAKAFGATAALPPGAELDKLIGELTNGEGVDLVVEAVGRNETIDHAIGAVRKGGTVILVGNISPEVTIPLQRVVSRQIRLQGSCASAGEYPRAIELMESGAVDVKPLITAVAPLAEGPEWFKRLHAREPGLTKVILTPGAAA